MSSSNITSLRIYNRVSQQNSCQMGLLPNTIADSLVFEGTIISNHYAYCVSVCFHAGRPRFLYILVLVCFHAGLPRSLYILVLVCFHVGLKIIIKIIIIIINNNNNNNNNNKNNNNNNNNNNYRPTIIRFLWHRSTAEAEGIQGRCRPT